MTLKKEILLAYFPKFTHQRIGQLHRAFGSLDAAWISNPDAFRHTSWDEALITEFFAWKRTVDETVIQAQLSRDNIQCLTQADPAYPPLLREIYDPPLALFVRGTLAHLQTPLAVVGTRANTPYGKQVTEEIVSELARRGLTIVSGLALGIDGLAHTATLAAAGRTIAVLGTGIDRDHVYPAAHKLLANRIVERGGAVISEYPPGSLPTQYSFPRRNRIIAGISQGTLVIEAGEGSGALITAQCSLDNNREVFAIPQNITSPTAVGVNQLIKMGAKVVTSIEDIFEALNLKTIATPPSAAPITPDSPTEASLLPHLSRVAIHIDELIKKSALPSPTVTGALTLMEMKGKVKNLGGMMYVLTR